MVRVQDLGLTWKLEFDITLYRMPAFDKDHPINIFHLTQNGNDDKDNIVKFSILRQGSHGQFIIKYWNFTKTMLFNLGTPYHVIIKLMKARRGRYEFVIAVDDDYLIDKNLKDLKQAPRIYKHAKLYCSNPWDKTMPSKIGRVKNFLLPNGKNHQCCHELRVVINSSQANLQTNRAGRYIQKGKRNGKYFWVSKDGQWAIWYYMAYKEWMIGSKFYLGTSFRGISAGQTSVSCPNHNHKRWSYWNGLRWVSDLKTQIQIFCTDDYSKLEKAPGQYNLDDYLDAFIPHKISKKF